MSLLKICGLAKFYSLEDSVVSALDGINLEVEAGEFIVIVGRSGSGKTTLLRILAGLESATAGEIEFKGRPIGPGHFLRAGVVFQEPRLLPWLTVEKNIFFPFLADGRYNAAREKNAGLLAALGLEGYANAMPYQLSGGMAQRAALGRALSDDPEIVLLDEPLGALDYFTRGALQQELVRLYLKGGKTFIMVTHDIVEALLLASKVLVLKNGKIIYSLHNNQPYPRRRGNPELQELVSEALSAIGGE